MKTILLITTTLILITACQRNQKFDSNKWKEKGMDWVITDIRENMVEDLIQSDTLISLNKTEIIELLGEPDEAMENTLIYFIREQYEMDIDPVYISKLFIELDANEIAINCKTGNLLEE